MDPLTKEARSDRMRRVRQRNTTAEICVRRAAHKLGLRFRLHRRDLPGSPDLVFVKYRTSLFVHGCFWHRHEGCRMATTPKTRTEYWLPKFDDNLDRDRRKTAALEGSGWKVAVIWECESENEATLIRRLREIFRLP